MKNLKINSPIRVIESGVTPTINNLPIGNLAIGLVEGEPKIFANLGDEKITIFGSTNLSKINYSTSEQDTNIKWVNGKTIYQKTFDMGTITNYSNTEIKHNISNIDSIISITGIANSSTESIPLPAIREQTSTNIGVYIIEGNIIIHSESESSMFTGYVTLQYTCTDR